jgi:hypothetical protein
MENKDPGSGKPPFFKSWNGMYAFVLGNLVACIILFYLLTKIFNDPS